MNKENLFQHAAKQIPWDREYGGTENTEEVFFSLLRDLCASVYSVSKALGFQH